jgi:hypothetical protein
MAKKGEQEKKNSKSKATSGKHNDNGKSGIPNDFSGTIDLTLSFENGTVTPVSVSFHPQKNGKKIGAKPEIQNGSEVSFTPNLSDHIFIRENKILQRVLLGDILFIQAMGDYVTIYVKDRKITIHQNLKALEAKLPRNRFIRIHRSFMVSLDKIDAIEESTVYINSHPVPIGEAYKSKLMRLLSIIR